MKRLSVFIALCLLMGLCSSQAADTPIEVLRGKDPEGFSRSSMAKISRLAGPIDNYEIRDGAIVCKPGQGGRFTPRIATRISSCVWS